MQGQHKILVIGGSTGSFGVVKKLLAGIQTDFPMPILFVLHRLKNTYKEFTDTLGSGANVPVVEPRDKEALENGVVYVVPANYHFLFERNGRCSLSVANTVHDARPAIDVTLQSAAHHFGKDMIGVVLTGANSDGAAGLKMVKDLGGYTIVQDPKDSYMSTMPEAVLAKTSVDEVLTVANLVQFVHGLADQN